MSNYILNSNKLVYHKKDCYCVEFIEPSNIIETNLEGLKNFKKIYRPCSKCLKEDYKEYIDNLNISL